MLSLLCSLLLQFQVPVAANEIAAVEALSEVNAARAKKGLPPYIKDDKLTQGALKIVVYRAERGITAHTRNDFAFLPEGAQAWGAGSGTATPDFGWMSCFTYDRRATTAGAAYAIKDGRRFMHIFVR